VHGIDEAQFIGVLGKVREDFGDFDAGLAGLFELER